MDKRAAHQIWRLSMMLYDMKRQRDAEHLRAELLKTYSDYLHDRLKETIKGHIVHGMRGLLRRKP